MSDGGAHINLRQTIMNLDALPAMPVIAQKLLALQMDTEEGERNLLLLIEQDPQISAKIVGLANTAAIGSSVDVTTIRNAAMLLGLNRVKSVATGIAIMSLMTRTPAGRFNMQDLWLHSFGIAFAMLAIARVMPVQLRPQDDHIFLAGLLHDIGFLALAFLDPKRSDRLHAQLAAAPQRPALEIERELLEVTHDELGSELVRHWNLPDEIIAVLRYHHTPDAAEAAAANPLARMIAIAEKLLPSFGLNEYVAPDISDADWEALGIDPNDADEIRTRVDEQADQAVQFTNTFT
ncbi:MAG: HDOD domain-containing protein [Nitrosomonadales bacterium]|nr:HDOD domain-containing protein [Nitrosomonadales bacterium]